MNNQFAKVAINNPSPRLIEAAAEAGLDVSALEHETTNYFVNHTIGTVTRKPSGTKDSYL